MNIRQSMHRLMPTVSTAMIPKSPGQTSTSSSGPNGRLRYSVRISNLVCGRSRRSRNNRAGHFLLRHVSSNFPSLKSFGVAKFLP
jgi:hypothetical protein